MDLKEVLQDETIEQPNNQTTLQFIKNRFNCVILKIVVQVKRD